uniref:F-box domain-containing protein n=1 Tax=Ascaris lumbricoides TaxID=6252 RepID=A0A9J2PL49_ASCLU
MIDFQLQTRTTHLLAKAMCQRGTRMAADVLCTEQPLSYFPIGALPMEIHLRILQYLPRSDLDKCSLVCRRWASVIDRNAHVLSKHRINSLTIEANKSSFTLTIKSSTFTKQYKQWHYGHMDNVKRLLPGCKRRWSNRGEGPPAKLSSVLFYIDPTQPTVSSPSALLVPLYISQCESTDERLKRKHEMHTPPQALFQRVARCFEHAEVGTFRIRDLRLTDEFVEKLSDAFTGRPIKCEALKMKFCKLSYISPKKFVEFIQLFNTNCVSMAWIRGNNGHISMQEAVEAMCNKCRTIDICSVTPETSAYNNEFFRSFLRNSHSEKILRLDYCSISNTALLDAVKHWKASPTLLFQNICLSSDAIDWSFVVNSLFPNSTAPDGCYTIKHPTLATCLKLWRDDEGVHLVNTGVKQAACRC